MTWLFEVYVIYPLRCLLKFLCMFIWRFYGRRDVYFLNIYYIRVFDRFNRSRALHIVGTKGVFSTIPLKF